MCLTGDMSANGKLFYVLEFAFQQRYKISPLQIARELWGSEVNKPLLVGSVDSKIKLKNQENTVPKVHSLFNCRKLLSKKFRSGRGAHWLRAGGGCQF